MKHLVGTLALAIGAAFSSQAAAADVEGSTSGVWQSAVPGDATVTGLGSPSFSWGVAVQGSTPSSLQFQGDNFASAFETPFKLGTISYLNGTIANGTGASSVELELTLNFSIPALGQVADSFQFDLINTPNVGTTDNAADFVTLPDMFGSRAFSIEGVEYRVMITGFDNVAGDGFLNSSSSQFHVREGGRASADLYAMVTTALPPTPPVPEPETYALLLVGLAIVGLWKSTRKH